MISIGQLNHENVEYLDEVLILHEEAKIYLESFTWCESIIEGWLAEGWGYMLCVFYFKINVAEKSSADEYIWIIVGDLPPAYIDIESAGNKKDALLAYVFLMDDWINHVNKKQPVDKCFPVNVLPTLEHAAMLKSRLEMIQEHFISQLE